MYGTITEICRDYANRELMKGSSFLHMYCNRLGEVCNKNNTDMHHTDDYIWLCENACIYALGIQRVNGWN